MLISKRKNLKIYKGPLGINISIRGEKKEKELIKGIKEGYEKSLEIVGIGYKAEIEKGVIKLNLGYSEEKEKEIWSESYLIKERNNTKIRIKGIKKEIINRIAKQIRKIREPDSYKGKGIKIKGEEKKLKEIKKSK